MSDPLWVAEYTLYLEENFCSTQAATQRYKIQNGVTVKTIPLTRCVDLVKEHFPSMHSMAVDQFWNPDYLCGLQPVCGETTSSSSETTIGQLQMIQSIFCNFDIHLGSNFLDLVSLENYQMGRAICNDGTPAVYYRNPLNGASDSKKLLIFLQGGGMCVPNLQGKADLFNIHPNV